MDDTKRGSLNLSRVFTSTIQKVKEGASDFDNLPPVEDKGAGAGEKVKEGASDFDNLPPVKDKGAGAGEKGNSVENFESRQKQTSSDGTTTRPTSNQNRGKNPKVRTKRSGEDPRLRTTHSSGENSHFTTKCGNGEDSKFRRTRSSGGNFRSKQTVGSGHGKKSGPEVSGLPGRHDAELPLNSRQSLTEGTDKQGAILDSSKSTPVVQHLDLPKEKSLTGNSSENLPIFSPASDCNASRSADVKPPEKDSVSERKSVVKGKGNRGEPFVKKTPVSRGRGFSQRYTKQIDGTANLAQQPGATSVDNTNKNICSKEYGHRSFEDRKTGDQNVKCQSEKPIDREKDCEVIKTVTKPAFCKQETKPSCRKPEIKPWSSKSETKATRKKQETVCSRPKPEIKSTCRKPDTKPAHRKLETKQESQTLCQKSPEVFVYPSTECWDSDTSNKSNSKQELGKDSKCRQESAVVETDRASKTDSVSDVKSESRKLAGEQTHDSFVKKTGYLEKVEGELKSVEENTDTTVEQKFSSNIVGGKIRERHDQVPERNITGNTSKEIGKAWFQGGKKSRFYDRGTKKKGLVKQFEGLNVSDKGVAAKTSVVESIEKRQDQSKDKCLSEVCEFRSTKVASVDAVGSRERRGAQDIQRNSGAVGKRPFSTGTRYKYGGKGSRNADKITGENTSSSEVKTKSRIENINDIGSENIKKDVGDKETNLKEEGSAKKKKKKSKREKRRSSGQCSCTSGDIVGSRRESGNSWESANSGGKESRGHRDVFTSSSSRVSNPGQLNRSSNQSGQSLGSENSSRNSCGRGDLANLGRSDFEPKGQVGSAVFEQNGRRNKSANSLESEKSGGNTCRKPNLVNRGQSGFGPGRAEQNRPRNRSGNSWESENCTCKGALARGAKLDSGTSQKSSCRGGSYKNIEIDKKTDKVPEWDNSCSSVDRNKGKKLVHTISFGRSLSEFEKNLPPRFRKLQERKEFENSTSEGHKHVEEHFSVRNSSCRAEERRDALTQNVFSKKFDSGKLGRGRRVLNPEIKRLTDNLVEKLNLHGCVKTPGEDRKKTRSSNSSVARPAPWRTEVPFVLEGSEEEWSEDSIPLPVLGQKVLSSLSDDLSAGAPVAVARSSPLPPASAEAIPSVGDKAGVLHRTASWVESLTEVRYSYDVVTSFEETQLVSPFVKDANHNQQTTHFLGEKMSRESDIKMQAPVKNNSVVDENANIVNMKSQNPDKSEGSVCVVDCKSSDDSSRSRGPSPASCEDFFSAKSGSQVSGSTMPSERGRKDKRKVSPEENKQNKMARGMVNRRRSPFGSRNDPPRQQFDNRSRGFNFRGPPPGMMGRNPYMGGGHHQSGYFQSPPNEAQPYSFGSFPSPNKPQDVGRPQRWCLDANRSPTELSPRHDVNIPAQYSPETLARCRLPPPPPPGFGTHNNSRGLDKHPRTISPRLAGPGFLDRSRSPVSSCASSVGPSHQNTQMAASHGSPCSVETDNVCVVDVRHVPSSFHQRTLEELVKAQDVGDRKSRDTEQVFSSSEIQTKKRHMGVFKMPDKEGIEQLKVRQRAYRGRGRGTAVQSASATCLTNRPGSGSYTLQAVATVPVMSKSCDSISMSSLPKTLISDGIKQEPDEATRIQKDTHCKGNESLEENGVERTKALECVSTAEKETEGKFVAGSMNRIRSPAALSESYSSVSGSKSNESIGKIALCSQSDDTDESFGLVGENSDLNASMESESTDGQKFVVDDRGLFTESDPECSDAEARNGKPVTKSSYHHPQPFLRWRKTEASPLVQGSPFETSESRGADSPYSSYSPLPKGRGISPLTFDKHCQVRNKNKKQDDSTPVKVLRRGEAIPEDIKPSRGELGRLKEIKEEQGHSLMSMNRKTLFPKSEPGVEENSGDRVDGIRCEHDKLSLHGGNKLKQEVMIAKENTKAKLDMSKVGAPEEKIAKPEKKVEKSNPVDWFEEGSPQQIQDDSFSNKEALMHNARTRWSQTTSAPVFDPWLSQYDSQQESGAAAVKDSIATSVFYPGLINAGMGPMLDAAEKRMSAPLPNLWSRHKKGEQQKEKAKDAKKFGWRRSTGSLPSAASGKPKRNSWSSSLGPKTYLYMPEPKSAANKAGQMGSRTFSWGSLNDLSEEALSGLTDSPARSWKTKFREKLDNSNVPYVDSHCHIDFLYKRINYRGSWMKFQMMYADTFMHNYYACVTNFCDPNSFRDNGMWKQILPEDGVYGSFGCHPKSATDYTDEKEEFLKHIIHHSKVVSLGEIGLDYSRGFDEHRECQKEVFVRQLKIAVQNKMPLVIHCREAEEDCLSLMMEHVPQDHLIHRHCFTGHWYELEPWLAYFSKCYVGLTPLVTFRSAECVHDVARRLPLERLLLETDAPYFRPPYVDKDDMNYSTPGMAICVAHEVARLRGIPMDDVLLKARSNTLAMYGV